MIRPGESKQNSSFIFIKGHLKYYEPLLCAMKVVFPILIEQLRRLGKEHSNHGGESVTAHRRLSRVSAR